MPKSLIDKLGLAPEEVEIRYSSWIKVVIDMIKPKDLFLIAGRGTGKTTDIHAERTIDVCYDMPRSPLAFVSDTYTNLLTNIVPSVISGWEERKGWKEGHHFVVDKEPPANWPKPVIKTFSFKHTISTFLGNKFFLISLDRPSISAGISVVHLFMDEVKYHREDRIRKLIPTLRGDASLFGGSHYFMGQTATTDMPNTAMGEQDWILQRAKNMNKEQIRLILQGAMALNEIYIELVQARKADDLVAQMNIEKKVRRWEERLKKLRQGSVFFNVVSTFANVDVLTADYIQNQLDSLGFEEFRTSVLSLPGNLEKGSRFYGQLGVQHFYNDGYQYDYFDQFGLRDFPNAGITCQGLRYIDPGKPLEAGVDFGNMLSMVIGQDQGEVIRALKNLYVLNPDWIRQIADRFLNFFQPHANKYLKMWYDRAGNAYSAQKEDFAGKLKDALEYREVGGKRQHTGWKVELMSRGQSNITHAQEFDLMNELMAGTNKALPRLLIDQYECKELKSSLELTPLRRDSKTGQIKKVKTSEKIALHRLPMESTNMSDAFKYWLCRKKFLDIVQRRSSVQMGDPRIF